MSLIHLTKQQSLVSVQVEGRSVKEIIVNSAKALAAVLEGSESPEDRMRKKIDFEQSIALSAVDQVSLLVEWLMELVKISDLESVVLDQVSIESIDETSLVGRVSGYHIDKFFQPISSVNYETVKIEENERGLKATFTLEL